VLDYLEKIVGVDLTRNALPRKDTSLWRGLSEAKGFLPGM